MTERDQVFISYSHHDQEWLERLQTNLRPLVRKGSLNVWDDTRIQAGQEWRAEIDQALARARVAVLLVSPDFLASDFIADVELPAILKAARRGGLQVIWIPIRASLFAETELGKYQAAWDPARPLAELKPAAHDKAFVEIAKMINDAASRPPRDPTPDVPTRLSGGPGSRTATRSLIANTNLAWFAISWPSVRMSRSWDLGGSARHHCCCTSSGRLGRGITRSRSPIWIRWTRAVRDAGRLVAAAGKAIRLE